jgi:aminomethyltransferase
MTADGLLTTPLHAWHQAHHGRLVEFAGWSMPVQYSSIIEEHQAVRKGVGLFDIGHMGRLHFHGPDARAWLDYLTTNNVARLVPGQIQYSLMVDESGGVLDDILVYHTGAPDQPDYLVVCNASNRDKVVAQFERHRGGFDATLTDHTLASGMIAVQGPAALAALGRVLAPGKGPDPASLKYYHVTTAELALSERAGPCEATLSRTGYTGEDGFELIVPRDRAEAVWSALMEAGQGLGIRSCGLGARDTLRLEAAMPLYGHEMDETVNPYAAGLGWAVKLEKGDFIGRDALRRFRADPGRTRIGLTLEGRRIARQGAVVKRDGTPVGSVTSGTFSPTLGRGLAMALVEPGSWSPGTRLAVDVRGADEPAEVVRLPFYRRPEPVRSSP